VEDWALIRRLVADGVPQRQVARDLGIGRSTVARALASGGPPKYERPSVATSFTPFEPAVRQLLAKTPDVPATVIAERVGWTGSITWFRDNVRQLRPDHRRVDPADRLIWLPGEAAQCDLWFPPKKIPLETVHGWSDDPDPDDGRSAAGHVDAAAVVRTSAASVDLGQRDGRRSREAACRRRERVHRNVGHHAAAAQGQ
jgi:hypothetical protein